MYDILELNQVVLRLKAAASPICLTVPLGTVPDSNRLWNAIKALTLQIVIYHTNIIVFSLTPNLFSSDPYFPIKAFWISML
jgi:hypothetical protein